MITTSLITSSMTSISSASPVVTQRAGWQRVKSGDPPRQCRADGIAGEAGAGNPTVEDGVANSDQTDRRHREDVDCIVSGTYAQCCDGRGDPLAGIEQSSAVPSIGTARSDPGSGFEVAAGVRPE